MNAISTAKPRRVVPQYAPPFSLDLEQPDGADASTWRAPLPGARLVVPFRVAVLDPPWPEKGGGKIKRGADRHYPVIPLGEIAPTIYAARWPDGGNVWLPDVKNGAHVWCWATSTYLRAALELLEALGATYKTHRAWVKSDELPLFNAFSLQNGGLGQYGRGSHELLLLGTVGPFRRSTSCKLRKTVILAPRTVHSAKPAEPYEYARELAGIDNDDQAVELFARRPREGWRTWGDERPGCFVSTRRPE